MALTKVTGQVINDTTGLVVGVTTVGGGVSAVDGFFSGIVTFSNSVSVAGTLTYEDVTNIDAVGLVTARNGIVVGSGITLSKDGDGFFTGVITATSYSGIDLSDVTGATGDFSIADKIVHTGDTNTAIRFPAADTITAETGGSERVRITSTGLFGIGTTPEEIFHVKGPSETVSSRDGVFFQHNTDSDAADTGLPLVWSGRISSGLANYGLASICGRKENSTGGDGASYLQFATCNSAGSLAERFRIDSSGRLGIGTASGTRGLSVEGTGNASRAFFNDSTNHKAIEFGADSNGSFQSTLGDNPHLIYTNGTERARFTSDGLKFADGKGIDFSSRSGSASGSTSALFDDYEEGAWTPSFAAGETLTVYSARYTKIGRLVTANCYIYNFSDLSGNNSRFDIEGLPYTASGSNYHGGGFIGYIGTANYGYPILPLVVQGSNVGYFHRQDGSSSTWKYVDMHNVGNGQNGHLIVTFIYETST